MSMMLSHYVRSEEGGSPIQPQQSSAGLVRLGVLALPLAGLLSFLVGLISPIWLLEPFVFASEEPQVAAAEFLTSGFFVS